MGWVGDRLSGEGELGNVVGRGVCEFMRWAEEGGGEAGKRKDTVRGRGGKGNGTEAQEQDMRCRVDWQG